MMAGCAFNDTPAPPPSEPTKNRAQLAATQPSYWIDKGAVATVSGDDFDALWSAARQAARSFLFKIDREDFRAGVMTTEPLASKQWFEVWRRDVPELDDLADSSLATYRRTIRFKFTKHDDGYEVAPIVLIERFSSTERRVTASSHYRASLLREPKGTFHGTRETDRGIYLPPRYWYATGRDETLEKQLAASIKKQSQK